MDNVRPRASSSSPPKGFFNTRTVVRPKSPKPIIKYKWVRKESTAGTQAILPLTKGEKGSVVSRQNTNMETKLAYLDHRHKIMILYKTQEFEYGKPKEELKESMLLIDSVSQEVYRRQGQTLDFQELQRGYVAFLVQQMIYVADLLTKDCHMAKEKEILHGSTGLNEVDVNSGIAQVNEGTAEVHEGTAEVHEGTDEVHESTAEVYEGTAKVHEDTDEVLEGTAQENEGTAEVIEGTDEVYESTAGANLSTTEVKESTAGANLSTEPSMKVLEDEAGPSTFQDESDEFIQDDTLIVDILVNISRPRRGAGITIPEQKDRIYTEEQKAKFLVETIAAQRRFRAEQQAALRRSKPPTISQLRNQMMKQDLHHLHRLVVEYYEHIPPTGLGVHILELENGAMIHMLVEQRYPLTRELIQRMLEHKLEVQEETEDALNVISPPWSLPFLDAFKEWNKYDADKDLKIIEAQTHLHIRNQEQNQRKLTQEFKDLKYKKYMEEDWKDLNKKLNLEKLEVKQVDIKLGEDCYEIL
ncbi:hypothetical protein Tco_0044559 [Tanacetum coccineum]